MEKAEKSTKIRSDKVLMKGSPKQNISHRKTSTKVEQSNKINTWLCNENDKEESSCPSSTKSYTKENKTESKNECSGYKSKDKFKHDSKKKDDKLKGHEEKSGNKGNKHDDKEKERHSSKHKLTDISKPEKKKIVSAVRTSPRNKTSNSQIQIHRDLNTTPIKHKRQQDGAVIRSPRHLPVSTSTSIISIVAKKLFAECGDKRKTENSNSSRETSKDKINKKKRRDGNFQTDLSVKRQKLDSDNSKNEIERGRNKNKKNEKNSKDRIVDSSSKKYKKENRIKYESNKMDIWLTKGVKKKDDRNSGGLKDINNKNKISKRSEHKIKSREARESKTKQYKKKTSKTNKVDKIEPNNKKNPKVKKNRNETNIENKSLNKLYKLDNFIKKTPKEKKSKKNKFSRTESSESCDFPTFSNDIKKSKQKSSESFKKYGVAMPSIEEILKDQKDLEQYKNQIEAFQQIQDQSFELPFSVKDLNRSEVNCVPILGCKHLTTEEITEAFKTNLVYVADIFHGKRYNERHDRFFNKENKGYSLTVKDLTYSTSMIVFSFEQKEHMIRMLKEEFDPEDKWTPYFFQVLLPELCLKIFMDIHEMTYEEAVKYLDVRPITND